MRTLDTVLLLALPASGKSELRRYLEARGPTELAELHLRPLVQLDDYPYVHLMRRISEELRSLGAPPVFFADAESGWLEPRDWGTLIHLLNEDYEYLTGAGPVPENRADHVLGRLDAARIAAGAPAPFASLGSAVRRSLCVAIEEEAAGIDVQPVDLAAHTVVIEFARGGPEGAGLPLTPPRGYSYSLSRLSPSILGSAVILYVWAEPSESRRRNRERTRPGREGDASILHHGVPEAVLRAEYGTDDMAWLMAGAEQPGTVAVSAHGRSYQIPAVRFDNRVDRTSFLRDDVSTWDEELVAALHRDLREAFVRLAQSKREWLGSRGRDEQEPT